MRTYGKSGILFASRQDGLEKHGHQELAMVGLARCEAAVGDDWELVMIAVQDQQLEMIGSW